MNTETGTVYWNDEDIALAFGRGEPIVAVSPKVAAAVEAGMVATKECCVYHASARNRAERRAADRTCPLVRRHV